METTNTGPPQTMIFPQYINCKNPYIVIYSASFTNTWNGNLLFSDSVGLLEDLETPISREEANSSAGDKPVNFAKSRSTESKPGTSFTNFSVPTPTKEEQEEDAKIQSMMEKYPETIPIIDEVKEEKKISTDLKVKGKTSQPMKTDSQARQQSGRKKDMTHVLSYLKKNKYDDTGSLQYNSLIWRFIYEY